MDNRNRFEWMSERFPLGSKITVQIKEEAGIQLCTGILKEMDHSGILLQPENETCMELIPFSVANQVRIANEDCTHRYCDGRGAVEPLGFPIREFRTMKITEWNVCVENDQEVGYCLICGSKQPANIPVEESRAYQDAMKEYEQQNEGVDHDE